MLFVLTCLNIICGSIITGLLGALGGADYSSCNYRRFGIPIYLFLGASVLIHHWQAMSILLMIGIFYMGYGIPDATDSGSLLGRFCYKLCRGNIFWANTLCRSIIGDLIATTLIPLILIRHNYVLGIVVCYAMKTVFATLAWRDLGGFTFGNKRLLWSEFIPYTAVGLATLIIIYL